MFESQAHHLCFFQFVVLKLLLGLEKNENKEKDAGIGPYLKKPKVSYIVMTLDLYGQRYRIQTHGVPKEI